MDINDLIVLRAIFIEDLHSAVMNKDLEKVKSIAEVECDKDIELNNELCEKSGRLKDKYYIDDIDIEVVYSKYQQTLKEDLSWAL